MPTSSPSLLPLPSLSLSPSLSPRAIVPSLSSPSFFSLRFICLFGETLQACPSVRVLPQSPSPSLPVYLNNNYPFLSSGSIFLLPPLLFSSYFHLYVLVSRSFPLILSVTCVCSTFVGVRAARSANCVCRAECVRTQSAGKSPENENCQTSFQISERVHSSGPLSLHSKSV